MAHLSDPETYPRTVLKYLEGIEFPASRQDLLDWADDHDAPDQVMSILQALPEQEFGSMQHVERIMGEQP